MADSDPGLLNHISAQLGAIEATLQALVVDVATLKAGGKGTDLLAAEVREQSQRIAKLEIQASKWEGAAGAGGKVGSWIAGIVSALLVAGTSAIIAYVVGRR